MSKLTLAVLALTLLIVTGLATLASAQQPISPYFFGMSMTGKEVTGEPWPTLPFSEIRLWDSAVPWSVLNPAPGVYNWALLDDWLEKAKQNDVEVAYCFGRVPGWASSAPQDHVCANEPGSCDPPWDLNSDGSGTDQAWRDFVTAIAIHAKGRIHYWELWDEFPDPARWHWPSNGSGKATIQQLLRMSKDAHDIIKSVDPSAVIVGQSGALRYTLDYPRWKAWAEAGIGQYVDIVAFHSYVQLQGQPAGIPETLIGLVLGHDQYPFGDSGFYGFLQDYNLTQPVWNTEGSWASDSGHLKDPDEQAGYVVRFYALNFSLDVQRFSWYEWDNTFGIGALWKWFTRWDLALPDGKDKIKVMKGFGDGSFQAPLNNQTGSAPEAAAVGDFNNDQKLDLVTANQGGSNVSVLLGNGDGTFGSANNSPAGNAPIAVAVGDFDRDHNLDVVVANSGSNHVNVLFGMGNGNFKPPVSYNVGANPSAVAVADFNNDGFLDIAVANAGSGTVSLLQNNGNGGFLAVGPFTVGNTPSALAVGDFNKDGFADLAVVNTSDGTVTILMNDTQGGFNAAGPYGVGKGPSAVAVADFNNDGYADIAVANKSGNSVSVLTNNQDGTFANATSYKVGSQPVSIVAEDFNGDGYPDIGTANQGSSSVSTLQNCAVSHCSHGFNAAMSSHVGSKPVAMTTGAFNVVGDNDPGTILKSGYAYQSVHNWFVGNTVATTCSGPVPDIGKATQGVWTCGISGPNGYVAQLVWYMDSQYKHGCGNNHCVAVKYQADRSTYKQYRTPYGEVTAVPKNGMVSIGYIPILLENHSEQR